LTSLFVINSDVIIGAASQEFMTIGFIITGEKLIILVVNFIQSLSACSVPMIQTSISISGNNNVLSDTRCIKRSPPI
jgi:hypothetical protein